MVKDILEELPDAYAPDVWERKSQIVFNHIFASFHDDGGSVYASASPPVVVEEPSGTGGEDEGIDVETVTASVIERISTTAPSPSWWPSSSGATRPSSRSRARS